VLLLNPVGRGGERLGQPPGRFRRHRHHVDVEHVRWRRCGCATSIYCAGRALIAAAVVDVNGHAVFGAPKSHQRRRPPQGRRLAR
jgi:hypothetical protein